MVGQGRPRRERGRPLRLVGDSANKQGNLLTKQVLDSHKVSTCLHLSARVLNICIEVLTGFHHIFSPDGPNNPLLSQSCIFENANGEKNKHFKDGEWEESPHAWSSSRVTQQPHPLRLPPTEGHQQKATQIHAKR